MVAPPLNLCVTSSSPSSSSGGVLGEGGPFSSRGSRLNFSRRGTSRPCTEFARSLLRLPRPQKVADAEQDPGEGGPVLWALLGQAEGAFQRGVPASSPRLGEGLVHISWGYPILDGLSGREPAKDKDNTGVGTSFFL